jgi:hypothetical protein
VSRKGNGPPDHPKNTAEHAAEEQDDARNEAQPDSFKSDSAGESAKVDGAKQDGRLVPGTQGAENQCNHARRRDDHIPGQHKKICSANAGAVERGECRVGIDRETCSSDHYEDERPQLPRIVGEARNRVSCRLLRHDDLKALVRPADDVREKVGKHGQTEPEDDERRDQSDPSTCSPHP